VGTCSIGTVVDPALKVHGVEALRWVDLRDADGPAGTERPTIMVAEKAALSSGLLTVSDGKSALGAST